MNARNLIAILAVLALLPLVGGASPTTVLASDSLLQTTQSVPPPAKNYSLQPADVGPGFRELSRDEPADGTKVTTVLVPGDVQIVNNVPISPSNIVARNAIILAPAGSDTAVMAAFNTVLDSLRNKYGANVQPAEGWGAEQVYSYAWAQSGVMFRGILLRHRNAVAFIEIYGLEQQANWDRLSGLTRIVEGRILSAVQ